jgi:uncharacterized membrane protein YgcG
MKFGRNLKKIVALSDPEWGPFWMNYNHLKRKIKREIAAHQGGSSSSSSSGGGNDEVDVVDGVNPQDVIGRLLKSSAEVEFFRLLREELKKTDDFYKSAEEIFKIRLQRVRAAFEMLKSNPAGSDKNTWTRLLTACVKLYRDVLMLENYCIMNYCGFSKILKKHDKATGFRTRDPFMFNVMGAQSFTEYLSIQELLLVSEKLFTEIQQMEHCMPLQEEERLFIEAIRELNRQASKVQRNEGSGKDVEAGDAGHAGAGGSSSAGGGGGGGEGGDSSDIDADELALHNAANAAVAAAQKASNSSTNSLKSMEGAKTNGGGKSPTVLPLVLAVPAPAPAPAAADAAANTATSRKRGTSTRDT